jgi:hypothetical protein
MDKDEAQRVVGSSDPMPVIDVNHLRLHEGRAYYTYKFLPSSSGLAVNASLDIAIAWPAGVLAHLIAIFQTGGESEFYLYESPTTSGGTTQTIHRRNRNLSTTSTAAAVYAPTVTATGTEIYGEFISSGVGGTGVGGENYTFEYVMKPLTTYLFRITNVNSKTRAAELRLEWYE